MRFKFVTCLILVTLLAGCALPGRSTPEITQTPPATPKPVRTATTPSPLVVLIIPADMPKSEADQYQTAIYNLAQASKMRFQVLNSMGPVDLQLAGAGLKIVVAFPPDPGLAALAASAPNVQFLAVGIPKLPAAPNLSTVGATGQPVAEQAFLAGYTAAMLSEDYRIGMITLKDDPEGLAAETAFQNGMQYYCGLCQIRFPPFYTYPIHVEIPQDASPASYSSYAGFLVNHFVTTAFVYPPIATSDLLGYLAQNGVNLIGETMPSQSLGSSWVASLKPELLSTIQKIFPELVAGHGGQNIPTPLYLTDVNPALLSPGKQRLVQELLDGLQSGTVSPGVTP